MERKDVKQRITQIKNIADRAAEACRSDGHIPEGLKQSIGNLESELDHTLQTLQQTSDDAELEQCIDDLEEAADQAKVEAHRASDISEQTRDWVLRTHNEISQLKHQLH